MSGPASRLEEAAASSRLCVGIDPHAWLLERWGLPDSADGAREFGRRVVDAAVGVAAIVKPQVAFFERHGSAGYAALEAVLAAARDAGLFVIADAKRGDLGTSVDAYGEAWLTRGSPLEADAMTVVAYQGVGSLDPVFARADAAGKLLFVLTATSNPQAALVQRAAADGGTVAGVIAAEVVRRGHGVVIGATISLAESGLDPAGLTTPILAPGFGHQGARIDRLAELFGPASDRVLVAASRSLLEAGPDGIATAIADAAREAGSWPS